jgi:muramidase (phage lysozyme)
VIPADMPPLLDLRPPAVVRQVEERPSRTRDRLDDVLACIRAHESDTAGGYRAVYSGPVSSTASGAYQMIDRTWRFLAESSGVDPVSPRAFQASPADQDRAARWALSHGYGWVWTGTGCPGTDR